MTFLQVLRQVCAHGLCILFGAQWLTSDYEVNPQFAEMDRREHAHGMMAGYAQQGTCLSSLPIADPF
jgi:hypothetical protein